MLHEKAPNRLPDFHYTWCGRRTYIKFCRAVLNLIYYDQFLVSVALRSGSSCILACMWSFTLHFLYRRQYYSTLITICKFTLLYSNIYPTRCNFTQFILSGNCSTCFGWYHHPSSGEETTVSTASGICHTVTATCFYRGRVGTLPR